MQKVARVGFFRELPHGDPEDGSLLETDAEYPFRAAMADYLQAGHTVVVSGRGLVDFFSPSGEVIAPCAYMTDGFFLYAADYPFYVRNYFVTVPQVLTDRAISLNWRIPEISDERMSEIGEQLLTSG